MEVSPEVIVRGRSVLTFPDLTTAGDYYLREYFSQWVERRAICIVPPIPWISFNRVLGPELKPEGRIGKERGDNAELMVYKTFFSCGEQYEEPMFLLAQLDYDPDNKSKKSTSVLSSFLPDAKLPQLARASKKLDIDLVIYHVEIGAVIVEIKAATNPLSDIGDALGSLQKGEELLRLFSDQDMLPVYKVAVFPNCVRESLSEAQMAEINRLEERNGFTCCDGVVAKTPLAVSQLLKKFKASTREEGYPTSLLEASKILQWMISMKCLVSSTSRDGKVVRLTLTDETVNVAKQVKMTDKKIVQHDVYSKADQKSALVKKVKISTEVLYLNPEQVTVLDGPKHQIIHGVAGTGKTVLIQHKVLDLDGNLAPDEQIIVVATDAVANVYRDFFHQNRASDRVKVYSKSTTMFYMEQKSSSLFAHHFFVDEAQNMTGVKDFLTMISKNKNIDKYLWIALDPVQSLEKMGATIPELESEFKIPCLPPLHHVMRCTPEVTHYWSRHLPVNCPVHYNQGNRLFVQDVPIYHAENNDRAVAIVLELLSKYVDGENVSYKDCAVLIDSPVLSIIPIRRSLLAKFGWSEQEYFRTMDAADKIMVRDMPNDIWSLEWSYVFLIAQDARLFPTETELDARHNKIGYWNSSIYLASSRCKVQLFLISMEKGIHPNLDLTPIHVKPERITFSFKNS